VIAAALLHPHVSPKAVESFRCAACDIQVLPSLEDSEYHDAAMIFGGDGTVHRYLPQLYKYNVPVLIVPKGSGNDFAKALGITHERVALRAWQQFCSGGKNVKQIDLGLVRAGAEEILFCCVAGMGLDSVANARANRMPAWLRGSAGYLLAALRTVGSFAPVEMKINAGPREIRRSVFFVAVGNAHSYGGGMKVTPQAQLDDGLLDVCVVGRMNKCKLLFWLPTIFFGEHIRIKQVEYLRSREVRIESARPLDVYADGDYACRTPVEISLVPRALTVIVAA
jgi:diacylglycerol kinase (ATP)